jgi:hypothetical protein
MIDGTKEENEELVQVEEYNSKHPSYIRALCCILINHNGINTSFDHTPHSDMYHHKQGSLTTHDNIYKILTSKQEIKKY